MIADSLQLPFPRYSLLPVGCPAVVHGHDLVSRRYPRGVYVVRDGRDALVSQYFYITRPIPDGDRPALDRRQRRLLPGLVNKAHVRENLVPFLERALTRPDSSPVNWANHVRSFFDVKNPNVVLLRYEDLLLDGERALADTVSKLRLTAV